MIINTRRLGVGVVALFAMTLAGCGGSGGSGVETGASNQTGFLSLGVSDGPVHSAQRVCIEFNDIEFKQAGSGETTVLTFAEPQKIDLLQFQGANAAPLITNEVMPAGDYEWMRLGINAVRGANGGVGETDPALCDGEASYIVMDDGTVNNLYVPSGANTGLKLVSGYTVPANDQVSLTLEFDVAKSITAPPGQSPDVKLRPTIRLVNNNDVGTLTGEVSADFVEVDGCEPSVYVFNPDVEEPNGIEDDVEDENDPIATAMVKAQEQDDASIQYHYTVGFLLTGSYKAAFTCNNMDFEPAAGTDFTIENAGDVVTVDFFPVAEPL
ncbi:MAG: DUF4382 domain-containing protein [Woeseiaceae bacterium]